MPADLRPAKIIAFDDDANDPIFRGVSIAAKAIGMTIGPKGWNVIMRNTSVGGNFKPVTTKDGVSVANEICLEDPLEDIGAQIAVDASRRTNDAAGDGTTCTVVLLHAMLEEARKLVRVGVNPLEIQRGMQVAKESVIAFIQETAKQVKSEEDLYNVAHVSCQDKEIARKITDAIVEVGEYGTVNVEAHEGAYGLSFDVKRGMHFDVGYHQGLTNVTMQQAKAHLQTKGNKPMTWQNDDLGVLIFDDPVRLFSDIAPLLESLVSQGINKLLMVADVKEDAAAGLLAQMNQQIITLCTIDRGNFQGDTGREMLKDIAAYTGAQFISLADGNGLPKAMDELKAKMLTGHCSAIVTRNTLSILAGGGSKEAVESRVGMIEALLASGDLDDFEKQKNKERIARFKAGIGTITISAPSEIERTSLRTRVDDAVCSVRSANEEGVVAGGGVALLRCYQFLKSIEGQESFYEDGDTMYGRRIVVNALLRPMWTIADVGGESGDVRVHEALKQDYKSPIGYNYWTQKEEDLFKAGIIDPAKVVRLCVENAVSVVGEMLRTRVVITDKPTSQDDTVPDSKSSPRDRALRKHRQYTQR